MTATQTPSPFKTMAEVRAANAALGHNWFRRDTMRFWNTRIESRLIGRRYFVTSEKMDAPYEPPATRLFTVRRVNDDGSVETVGEFQGYETREDALTAARAL